MKCSACQHDNPPDSSFCDECGARLELKCPSCNESNRPGAKFCRACGNPFTVASAKPAPSASSAPIPPHLAERILSERSALEGERKQVTVLFADLKGSMEMLAERDPEEARRILDPVLECMMEAVHRFEGTVNQVMGDGIMALFGAPLSQEDHAVRACYAALRMQERMLRLGEELRRSQGVPVQLRVGLNSGEVVVRAIGSDLRMDYSAVGQTTHLAARMEQLATAGAVLMTPDTLKLVEGFAQIKSLGPMSVKGLSAPLEVFELIGATAVRTRLQAASSRGLTRFVGRSREMDLLAEAINHARHGKGQVVAVVGEPGVGKSRLFHEFLRSHHVQGWTIAQAGSVSYGKATSYLPVIELLKGYFRIGDFDDARGIREKVLGKLLALDRSLEVVVTPLLSLLGQPAGAADWDRLDPPQRRRLTLDALKRLWLREAQNQPLLLVFEDLHWIDSESQEFLNEMMERIPASALLMLFNFRPEYQHSAWMGKSFYAQARLDPLSRENAGDLLAALLGTDSALDALKSMLIQRTEGNPFFLEECVKTLQETGALVMRDGGARLVAPAESIQMPSTVQAILAARIDRLAPSDKRLLQTAAVIGTEVPRAVLQSVAGCEEKELRESLMRLQAAEFLYEASLFPDIEYTFKHALTHEAAYGGLLQERRRELHGAVVKAIEGIHANRLEEQSEQLAMHADRAELWEKSRIYARRAAQRAFSRSANRDAVAWWEQALRAADKGPKDLQSRQDTIDLMLEMRGALFSLGRMDRVIDTIDNARRHAQDLGDDYRVGLALAYLIHPLLFNLRLKEGATAGEEALRIAQESRYENVTVVAYCFLAGTLSTLGQVKRGESIFREALRILGTRKQRERYGMPAFPDVYNRGLLGQQISNEGRLQEALDLATEGLAIAREENHPYSEAHATYMIGQIHSNHGNFAQGVQWCERALEICHTAQIPGLIPWIEFQLARGYLGCDQTERAHALLTSARATFQSFGTDLGVVWLAPYLADAELALGRPAVALEVAQDGLQIALRTGAHFFEVELMRALGDVHAHQEIFDAELAQRHYLRCLELAEKLDVRASQVRARLGFGRLLRKMGHTDEARVQWELTVSMGDAIGMLHWPDLARHELDHADDSDRH